MPFLRLSAPSSSSLIQLLSRPALEIGPCLQFPSILGRSNVTDRGDGQSAQVLLHLGENIELLVR